MPPTFDTPLPIDAVLDELGRTLTENNAAVLVAPPGAGKTTRVPLALLDAPWLNGKKIIMLEPRRIAARASAERMARTLGERAGETVGYRVRFGSKISRATRIEVVTEGIFSRQILDDPELTGVAAVLFDEFHERSLDADMGLALARDAQTGLREDLRILVMSATLDGARVGKLLGDAPVVASEGRAFPVETRYLGRKADAPLERQMADAVAMARSCTAASSAPNSGTISMDASWTRSPRKVCVRRISAAPGRNATTKSFYIPHKRKSWHLSTPMRLGNTCLISWVLSM